LQKIDEKSIGFIKTVKFPVQRKTSYEKKISRKVKDVINKKKNN
jgi:hypothetical protein